MPDSIQLGELSMSSGMGGASYTTATGTATSTSVTSSGTATGGTGTSTGLTMAGTTASPPRFPQVELRNVILVLVLDHFVLGFALCAKPFF